MAESEMKFLATMTKKCMRLKLADHREWRGYIIVKGVPEYFGKCQSAHVADLAPEKVQRRQRRIETVKITTLTRNRDKTE